MLLDGCRIAIARIDRRVGSRRRGLRNRTLYGNYGFTIIGEILAPGIPIRGLSMAHYDGNCKFTQVDHVVANGNPPAQAWTPGGGTYTVHPDCTGVAVLNTPFNPGPVSHGHRPWQAD